MSDDIVEDWHGKATNDPGPTTRTLILARQEVVTAIDRLRYSAAAPIRNSERFIEHASEFEFLYELHRWLTAFGDILVTVSDTTTDMTHELTVLRAQRTAIRKFLGLDERTTE